MNMGWGGGCKSTLKQKGVPISSVFCSYLGFRDVSKAVEDNERRSGDKCKGLVRFLFSWFYQSHSYHTCNITSQQLMLKCPQRSFWLEV